jgi:hypothetical protein
VASLVAVSLVPAQDERAPGWQKAFVFRHFKRAHSSCARLFFWGRITQFPIMKSAEIPALEAFNPLDAYGKLSTIADPHSHQRLGIFDK